MAILKGQQMVALAAAPGSITLPMLASQADQTILGNVSGASASPSALTATQVVTMINGTAIVALSMGSAIGGTVDLVLRRDAAGTLAQRNGANAQVLYEYNTFTDASNYERMVMGFVTNRMQLGMQKLGTGTKRAMDISASSITFNTLDGSEVATWYFLNNGNIGCATDNGHDLGESDKQVRSVYFGTSIFRSGIKILGAQGAAIADASGGAVIDAEARTALNALLARVRTHGLIAT